MEEIANYVYQPTRVLGSVADLVEELKSGQPSSRSDSPVFLHASSVGSWFGRRHQTDGEHPDKPRFRAPMAGR